MQKICEGIYIISDIYKGIYTFKFLDITLQNIQVTTIKTMHWLQHK